VVHVADRVFERWHELDSQFKDPSLALLFSSTLSPSQAAQALEQAAEEAMRELMPPEDPGPGVDEARVGGCSVMASSVGVVLNIEEGPDDFDALLGLIVAGLERREVEGEFDVYEPADVPEVERTIPLLECHIRVLGARYRYHRFPNEFHSWRADQDALRIALDGGLGWCTDRPGAESLSIKVDLLPRVSIASVDELETRLREAMSKTAQMGVFDVSATGSHWQRTVAVEPSTGRIALIEGAEDMQQGGWRAAAQEMKGLLAETAGVAVYGFVKHGSNWYSAQLGDSLGGDWPAPDIILNSGREYRDYEDLYAPDAFAIQLLGPGYAGRIPEHPHWRRVELDPEHVILEHTTPSDWFETAFAPHGGNRSYNLASDPPDVLVLARQELEPIIVTPEELMDRRDET
jgi:hypothetical protein